MKRDFVSTTDFTREELESLLEEAARLKADRRPTNHLAGKSMAMVFFNPSLRTRTSMELAMHELGGHAIDLAVGSGMWDLEFEDGTAMLGKAAEHVKEAARVLARYSDVLGVRAFPAGGTWEEERKDKVIRAFAKHAPVPVVNLESSLYHPCQAIADGLTVRERFGRTRGVRFLVTWAYHPKALPCAVPNSAMLVAAQLGMDVRLAHPPGFELDSGVVDEARELAAAAGGSLSLATDRREAFDGAQVVYAKSWGALPCYGKPEQEAALRKPYSNWIVDEKAMDATDDGLFMHCLPVRRNVVVSDGVLDSNRSIVCDQAENRLHAQKALLLRLLA